MDAALAVDDDASLNGAAREDKMRSTLCEFFVQFLRKDSLLVSAVCG